MFLILLRNFLQDERLLANVTRLYAKFDREGLHEDLKEQINGYLMALRDLAYLGPDEYTVLLQWL